MADAQHVVLWCCRVSGRLDAPVVSGHMFLGKGSFACPFLRYPLTAVSATVYVEVPLLARTILQGSPLSVMQVSRIRVFSGCHTHRHTQWWANSNLDSPDPVQQPCNAMRTSWKFPSGTENGLRVISLATP